MKQNIKIAMCTFYAGTDYKKKMEETDKCITNFENMFSYFFGAWKIFSTKLENLHLIIK